MWKPRELSILRLLAEGLTDRAIAARLGISAETVRWYNKQLYERLGANSRTQATRRATELGLLDVPVPAASAVRRSPIRYVNRDGVYVAYQLVGDGPVDLLFVHGFVSHLELAWEEPEFAAFFEALGRSARVILFDKRGVGLSDRGVGAPSLEDTIADACAVLDAAGSQRAFVMGTSEGAAAGVLLASMRPERVRGLILFGATPKPVRDDDGGPAWARPIDAWRQRLTMIQDAWGQPWAIEQFAPSRAADERFRAWWSRTLRAASSPTAARAVLEAAAAVDIRALLPHVMTRALVLHREGDRVVDVDAGRWLAAQMPNATWAPLPGRDHVYFVDGAGLAVAVARFLERPDDEAPVDSRVAVILTMAGAGATFNDEKRALLDAAPNAHLRATRDAWTALFEAPQAALRSARRLAALGRGRVGGISLHVGACAVVDGRPLGDAPEVARRLAESAAPGEVLVSTTLRDILAGSDAHLTRRMLNGDGLVAWVLVD